MNEHAEDPAGQASSKVVQYVSLATMAAEAIAQVRQQRAAAAAAVDERAAAAVRAERTSALAAARLHWKPILDPKRRDTLGLADTGLTWAATQAWLDTDPEAGLACIRAEERLRELRPEVMERFARLTRDGLDPVEAMLRVAPFFVRDAARPAQPVVRPALSEDAAAGPAPDGPLLTAADIAARHANDERGQYATGTVVLDDPATADVDERLEATAFAEPHLTEAATQDRHASDLEATASTAPPPSFTPTLATARTAPQIAKDGYPEPLTGEVLAGGRAKPKTPATTAPAAVRSTGLATAARAAGRAR